MSACTKSSAGERQSLLRRHRIRPGVARVAGSSGVDEETNLNLFHQQQPQIAMPASIYEETLKRARYGQRQYPTQEDAGSWDDLSESRSTRGGVIGFSLSGTELDTDLAMKDRITAEESR